MKLRFIYNPCSGRNRHGPRLPREIRAFIATHRLDAALVETAGPGHATELAREALGDGCDRVIAVGGDGTMNEVAQALLHSPAALGLIPCGSGNGLARHLGLPVHPRQALEFVAAVDARTAVIDTGVANGRPFFNAMGSGFDAEISRRFNQLERRGLPAYARIGLAAFWKRVSQTVVIRTPDRQQSLETLLVAVANSDQYGNGARIAPAARVDDGLLDLIAVRPVSLSAALPLIARLFFGGFDRSPHVLHLRGSRFILGRTAPGLIHTDGETCATSAEIVIEVRARSLRVLVPAGRGRPAPYREPATVAHVPVAATAEGSTP